MLQDPLLQINSITKVFDGKAVALQDVSFEVGKGEFVHLLGPNRAGKTTLLKLVASEHQPTAGEIIFDGQEIRSMTKKQMALVRRKLGLIFPDLGLIDDMDVFDNVALGPRILGRKESTIGSTVNQLLHQMGLWTRRRTCPAQLSSAERQRVAIARALAKDPLLLLADDPALSLDQEGAKQTLELLKKINLLGTAVLLATRPSCVFEGGAARVINIENGRIVKRTIQFPRISVGAGEADGSAGNL
jgi:cell division transport system ATP-binding protein